MTIEVELQIASEAQTLPHPAQFKEWIGKTLADNYEEAELTIRIVDADEMFHLNSEFRDKQSTTNVLSFPAEINPDFGMYSLGDIVICAPVILQEAEDNNIKLLAHWAHMVVHGTLHLMGYDHVKSDDAVVMEALETKILTDLGYDAPYGKVKPND